MMFLPRKNNQMLDPFREVESLQKEMNRLFNFSLARLPEEEALFTGNWAPAVDLSETKDNIIIKADLPGLKKEEIEVTVENSTLTIRGERKREEEIKEKNYCRAERVYGEFFRSIALPTTVDSTKVNASYKEGVLEVTIPKKEEAKPKRISIDVK